MPDTETGMEYPLLDATHMENMLKVFEENVGPNGVSEMELPRIKCPTGGQTTWMIQTADGEEALREIEGIVLSWRLARVFWRKSLDEQGGRGVSPPDCVSRDGFYGVGDPGGKCSDCPYARFGSSSKGRGQACKQMRQILLVRPGESLPHLLNVPPTSLRNASQYFLMLAGRQVPYWGVATKIRLERATNENGVSYARLVFSAGRRLMPNELQVLHPYHEQMRQLLSPVTIESKDYTVIEEPPPPSQPPESEEEISY
jgi:hypothetical protein